MYAFQCGSDAQGSCGVDVKDPCTLHHKKGPEAFALPKTVIVDVVIDREENVAPMVPAGKSITEMILV